MKKIDNIEQWNILCAALKEKGWRLWQMQYRWNEPEGFHAWFWKEGKKDVEVVTYSEEVQEEILRYNESYGKN